MPNRTQRRREEFRAKKRAQLADGRAEAKATLAKAQRTLEEARRVAREDPLAGVKVALRSCEDYLRYGRFEQFELSVRLSPQFLFDFGYQATRQPGDWGSPSAFIHHVAEDIRYKVEKMLHDKFQDPFESRKAGA